METCPAAEPPPKKQRTEEVTPPLIAPEQQLSAEQQASREKQLEHVFELCARARPGSPMRAFLAQFHNRLRQGWSRFETMDALQYALSEEWTLLMRHAPWTPRIGLVERSRPEGNPRLHHPARGDDSRGDLYSGRSRGDQRTGPEPALPEDTQPDPC